MRRLDGLVAAWAAMSATAAIAACGGDDGAGGDAGPPDAAASDASFEPMTLAETGLYAAPGSDELAPGVAEFTVNWPLWADGAEKRRFVYLPPGASIDTSDMDFWSYPVGTKIWKEFSLDGTRLETRLIWKQGPNLDDWYPIAFAWNADQTEAVAEPLGAADVLGTAHDIPKQADCKRCHARQPDFVLGFTAMQLDHAEGTMNLATLAADGRLTAPPDDAGAGAFFPLPGDDTENAALGYLHGNCGGCHHPESDVQDLTPVVFRLAVGSLASVEATPTYTTAVGVAPMIPMAGVTSIIEPHDRGASGAYVRMGSREDMVGMPPLATEMVDGDGREALGGWIDVLP